MNRDKKEVEYPAELESQFLLRLPEEPSKVLREVLRTGENLKNRLTIQVENDMRHGEVRFDNWVMHAKIVDLPTIVESLKTIDNKSFYKTADMCQIMICKEEPDQVSTEEESSTKNKKKDPHKVDKKFLYPHGITPPTKNIRRRRFRKTLKKKCVEAPEIEKEVKRLLRADNEAEKFTWEIVQEEDDHQAKPEKSTSSGVSKSDRKTKSERGIKKETSKPVPSTSTHNPSNVVDIFGGAVSDSDPEDEKVNVELEDSRLSYDGRMSDNNSTKSYSMPTEFNSEMFKTTQKQKKKSSKTKKNIKPVTATITKSTLSSEDDVDYRAQDISKDNMTIRIEQLKEELDELKQRRQRTQHEIGGMENAALRQRFQDILHTLNKDIMYKEMEYQGMITLQNSDDI